MLSSHNVFKQFLWNEFAKTFHILSLQQPFSRAFLIQIWKSLPSLDSNTVVSSSSVL